MTNIYNKKVLVENGTLINNWYEEEVLKNLTGQTRYIPGRHIKKRRIDGEFEIDTSNLPSDSTKLRTLGVEKVEPYNTTNMLYGDFSSEEHKFNKVGVKEKIFKEFFTSYLTNEKNDKNKHELEVQSSRLNQSSYKSTFIKQPVITKIGSRHMVSQDKIPIEQDKLDRYFMATHDMSKFSKNIPEDKAKEYFDMTVPYYNDKALTFWLQNADKSNVYKSHMNGENCFAKSSGLTQPLNLTKTATGYYGNVRNNKESKYVYIHPDSTDFSELEKVMKKRVEDLSESIRTKFLNAIFKKGWLAIRKYKQYLLNLSKRKSTIIEKSDFKFYTTNFGIYFSDSEIDFIYNLFDSSKNNKICYEKFIDFLIKVT
jgi:hypothetical protein